MCHVFALEIAQYAIWIAIHRPKIT